MDEDGLTVAERVRNDCLELKGVNIPISGGSGFSRDDPIVIEDTDPSRSAYWEHQVVGFIYSMRGEGWKFEKATIENRDGKRIEQFKFSREGDDENYYNYYFDVSASIKE